MEFRFVLRPQQALDGARRERGERLVRRGEDGERALPSSVSTRPAAWRAAASVENDPLAAAVSTMSIFARCPASVVVRSSMAIARRRVV